MARGLYTQGATVLLNQPVDFSRIQSCLSGFAISTVQTDDDASQHPVMLLEHDDSGGGQAIVILSDEPWPDELATPEESPQRFMAWTLGQYGPLTFPGGLQRAIEQSWRWDEGREEAAKHVAHIRVLYSYMITAEDVDRLSDDEDEALLVPEDADSISELQFVTRVISRLLELSESICYFNPGGEVLMNAEDLRGGLNECWKHEIVPVDMWTNVRLFRATDAWTLMDTIGNEQFDLPDMEVLFENEQFDPSEVESFLRNVVLCMLMDDVEINDGDTVDGPGDLVWCAILCSDGLNDPPRPTIRWHLDSATPPEELLDPGEDIADIDDALEQLSEFDDLMDEDDEE